MKRQWIFRAISLFGVCALSQNIYAAAFQFYELGAPVNGTAGVGQAAIASDASTSYFNPAGMGKLSETQFMLGAQSILLYSNFSPNTSTTIPGNNGSNAGGLIPSADGYFVYAASPKVKLGASLTSPYGGVLNYDNHWVGRYVVQQIVFYALDLNPVISYQFNEWTTVGAGVVVEYANLYQTVALNLDPAVKVDGQATVKVDNTSPGFNLGILLTPSQATKIGIAYRSQIVHHLGGNTNFANISTTPGTKAKIVMPANVIASIAYDLTQRFTLLGELGWANWSTMTNNTVSIFGFTAVTPQNWHNTYRAGVGGQYKLTQNVLLQAGGSYDSSPTSSSKRLPNLPADNQLRLGLGLTYAPVRSTTIGVSYEYINLGTASINHTLPQGTFAGSYSRNYANVFQASVNVNC